MPSASIYGFLNVLDEVDGVSEWDGVVDGRCFEVSERAFSIALVCEVALQGGWAILVG